MTGRFAVISILLFLTCWQTFDQCIGGRSVLMKDRLVFALCDQVDDYLKTGRLPGPVKKLPGKYKSVKPTTGSKMQGFRVIFPGGGKFKRDTSHGHPILDLLDINEFGDEIIT